MNLFKKTSNEEFHNPGSIETQNRVKGLGKIFGSLSNITHSAKNAILNTFSNTGQAGKDIWSEMKRGFGINPLKWGRTGLNMALILSQLAFVKQTIAATYGTVRAMGNTLGTTTQTVLGNEYKNKLMVEGSTPKYWYFDGSRSAPAAPRTTPTA